MKIERPHSYTLEEATLRVQALTDYWGKKYGIQSSWQANTAQIQGKVKGISFNGTLRIAANRMEAEVDVGFLAERLGGRAYVENKLAEYLNPQNSLGELQARAQSVVTAS